MGNEKGRPFFLFRSKNSFLKRNVKFQSRSFGAKLQEVLLLLMSEWSFAVRLDLLDWLVREFIHQYNYSRGRRHHLIIIYTRNIDGVLLRASHGVNAM